MALVDLLITPYAPVVLLVLYFVVPYFTKYSAIRDIPSPSVASFTNLWLLLQCRLGKRYKSVDEAHKKLGKFVRIQPDHVSIADADAIQQVYGHGNGFLKSNYYDAFVSIHRGLFKYMHANLQVFVRQWDKLSDLAHGGYSKIDSLHWFNYLAFDIIGDLAFGQPFGMLENGKDMAEIRKTPDSPVTYAPAVEVLNRRGEVSGTLGVMPWLKPYAKKFPDPFFSKGLAAVEDLAGMAVARVSARLDAEKGDAGPERMDLLARLMEGKDESGNKLGRAELTAEALTQLIAGSDTTSNTSCALLYWVLKTPGVIEKLQAELDEAIPAGSPIPNYNQVRDLKYMQNVINETLRIHSTSSLGLPRLVPEGGAVVLGRHFPGGTVLSVPAYTIHHSTEIWGPDAEQFRPERWDTVTEKQKNAFIPFSYGPRSCVGRNVAEMELALIVATVFRRYEFELYQRVLETREGFLRKPLECMVGVRKRKNV
jgi:benzoate 4-monooxygenase